MTDSWDVGLTNKVTDVNKIIARNGAVGQVRFLIASLFGGGSRMKRVPWNRWVRHS